MKCLKANYLEFVPAESEELFFNIFCSKTEDNGLQDYKHIGWISKPSNKDVWCFEANYNKGTFMFTQDTLEIILETIKRLNNGKITYNAETGDWEI